MKKCPHCHANIQENAVFCLYCMTSLEKKVSLPQRKKRCKPALEAWALALVCVFVLLAAVLLWNVFRLYSLPGPSSEAPPPAPSTTEAETQGQTHPPTTTPEPTEAETEPNTTTEPTEAETEPPTTAPKPTVPDNDGLAFEDVFLFRKAVATDCAVPEQGAASLEIVITGVKVKREVYAIPEQYYAPDGCIYTVIAILPDAFYNSGAKVVYTPSTLQKIHENAFRGCRLTDLYVRPLRRSFVLDTKAFFSLDTLHSPADTIICFRNVGDFPCSYVAKISYGANWEEWDP